MTPTVNDVSSPRFFTPLPFESGAAGPSGAAGGTRDDPHPRRGAVAHGVKRDASQMMTAEERDERVRKIVSLVKVLLTAKKIKEDSVPAEVVPGVFLGSVGAAHDRDALDACGITHVLTVAGGFPPKFPDVYEYLVIDVADVSSENLDAHFEKCLKFIARALLDGGRVLVHCFAGRSRSSTVVAAYVMATEGLSLEETMALIKNARPCAMPNAGFAKQLAAFERRLSAARSEGRLLGRVQLDAANDGINRLAAVAVDAAAGLESDASSEDEEREEEEGKGKVSDPEPPEEDDETNAEGEGGDPALLPAEAGATTDAKGS
uniref:Dual specificity phosphatase n=1 Tax=Micromonas pusilla TaxID=38833 RepID=A0A7S0D7T6_MICPS|mmetsp:Transcript_6207/g.26379  ORF Transcript_6207/g.26379 Transcript_6207/m.26379 type:complete len:319 (+) Transcript_6207:301-1257(+)